MPEINLFGEDFIRIFRDAVHAVGNYAEVYERALGKAIPRKERNLLNTVSDPGPLFYPLPGFDKLSPK